MKEKRRQMRRCSLSRLLFAVLFFSSLMSVYTAAKYVLTRHIAFAVAVDKSLLQGYVEKGLVWDLNTGGTSQGLDDTGYTITLMAGGADGSLSAGGSGAALEINIEADTLSLKTGYVTADGTAVETVVPCSAYEASGHSLTAAIVADTEKGEISTYIDNHLVQVYTLEDGTAPGLSDLTEFSGENLCSARIYNRALTQAELSQNYYMDLLSYGDYEGQELPDFIQKSSILRVDSLYDWEDAGARSAAKAEKGGVSIEDSEYRGIRMATASDAVMDYELASEIEGKTENGYTVRYIVSVNSGGTAEKLFTSGGQKADIEASIQDMDFTYKLAGKNGSITCGNEGKTVIDLTVDEQGKMTVYKNTEPVDGFINADTGNPLTDTFSICPSAKMDTDGELGAFYKAEVYDRALSPIELQYLYIRDEEAFQIGVREPLTFDVELTEDERMDGDWITFEAGDSPSWEEEEGYDFNHWFCKEYNVDLYDEDLSELSDAMEADGFHKVHIRPVYIPQEEPETLPEETETAVAEETEAGAENEETGEVPGTPDTGAGEAPKDDGAVTEDKESAAEESKPGESTPEESNPEESKPAESEPAESVPEESKPTESIPEENKPTESTPEESKPAEGKPTESTPEGNETDTGETEGGTSSGTEDKETGSATEKPTQGNKPAEPPSAGESGAAGGAGDSASDTGNTDSGSSGGVSGSDAANESGSSGSGSGAESGSASSGSTTGSSGDKESGTDKSTSGDSSTGSVSDSEV